jgi:hypothetical protein
MGRYFFAILSTLAAAPTAFAQPRQNVEFNLYERNPKLLLLLVLAATALVVIAAVFLLKRRKG